MASQPAESNLDHALSAVVDAMYAGITRALEEEPASPGTQNPSDHHRSIFRTTECQRELLVEELELAYSEWQGVNEFIAQHVKQARESYQRDDDQDRMAAWRLARRLTGFMVFQAEGQSASDSSSDDSTWTTRLIFPTRLSGKTDNGKAGRSFAQYHFPWPYDTDQASANNSIAEGYKGALNLAQMALADASFRAVVPPLPIGDNTEDSGSRPDVPDVMAAMLGGKEWVFTTPLAKEEEPTIGRFKDDSGTTYRASTLYSDLNREVGIQSQLLIPLSSERGYPRFRNASRSVLALFSPMKGWFNEQNLSDNPFVDRIKKYCGPTAEIALSTLSYTDDAMLDFATQLYQRLRHRDNPDAILESLKGHYLHSSMSVQSSCPALDYFKDNPELFATEIAKSSGAFDSRRMAWLTRHRARPAIRHDRPPRSASPASRNPTWYDARQFDKRCATLEYHKLKEAWQECDYPSWYASRTILEHILDNARHGRGDVSGRSDADHQVKIHLCHREHPYKGFYLHARQRLAKPIDIRSYLMLRQGRAAPSPMTTATSRPGDNRSPMGVGMALCRVIARENNAKLIVELNRAGGTIHKNTSVANYRTHIEHFLLLPTNIQEFLRGEA